MQQKSTKQDVTSARLQQYIYIYPCAPGKKMKKIVKMKIVRALKR